MCGQPAAHTKAYFNDVVFRYEYERAVREGHLVDYNVVSVKSNVRMNGVFLKEGEEVGIVDPRTGAKKLDLLEDERQFDTTEVERKVTSPDSNRKILEEVKKYALEHEAQYGRFPKTLVFAVNDLPILRTPTNSSRPPAKYSGGATRSCRKSPAALTVRSRKSASFATARLRAWS